MRIILAGLAVLVLAELGNAQTSPPERKWGIGLSMGTSTFNGAAQGTVDEAGDLVFIPYRPTMLGLTIARGASKWRAAISARYGEPGIAARGVPDEDAQQGVLIVLESVYKLAAFEGQLSTHLLRLRGGPSLRAVAGAEAERWSAPGTPVKWLFAPLAGLSVETRLTGRLAASIDGEVGYSSASPFHQNDLPEGFTPRSTWRRSLSVTVWLRL